MIFLINFKGKMGKRKKKVVVINRRVKVLPRSALSGKVYFAPL